MNVFEKIESTCVFIDGEPTLDVVCKGIRSDQQLITLFNENYIPINCRSSLEGVWQFAYQVRKLQRLNRQQNFTYFLSIFRIVSDSLENAIIQTPKFALVKRPEHSSWSRIKSSTSPTENVQAWWKLSMVLWSSVAWEIGWSERIIILPWQTQKKVEKMKSIDASWKIETTICILVSLLRLNAIL